MIEIWKDIEGYEGIYQISSHGRVRSLDRENYAGNNSFRKIKGKILKLQDNGKGYLIKILWNKSKYEARYIHRLVAEAFIENPNGYSQINHIDEDKYNNYLNNLEWCTHAYNQEYSKTYKKAGIKNSKIVINEKGEEFPSARDAAKTLGLNDRAISQSIKKKHKCGGLKWMYKK